MEQDFQVKNKKDKFKNKKKTKIRDRFGKARKNRMLEEDSIEKFIEGYNEFVEE